MDNFSLISDKCLASVHARTQIYREAAGHRLRPFSPSRDTSKSETNKDTKQKRPKTSENVIQRRGRDPNKKQQEIYAGFAVEQNKIKSVVETKRRQADQQK